MDWIGYVKDPKNWPVVSPKGNRDESEDIEGFCSCHTCQALVGFCADCSMRIKSNTPSKEGGLTTSGTGFIVRTRRGQRGTPSIRFGFARRTSCIKCIDDSIEDSSDS